MYAIRSYYGQVREDERVGRLMQVEGIGPITATAIVSAVGDARQFSSARQFAAWLGLVPRQHSSGGKACLGSISKRGDAYLRTRITSYNVCYTKLLRQPACQGMGLPGCSRISYNFV